MPFAVKASVTATSFFVAVLLSPLSAVYGQTSPALNGVAVPVTLSGRWDFEGKRDGIWSLRVDKLHPDGRIEGSVTWWGVRCNVRGEAIKEGSWRDGKLQIRVPTDNRFICEDLLIDVAGGTSHLFEGTAKTSKPGAPVNAWLERPK